MKKVLVLTLVLTLASMASASLSLVSSAGTSLEVDDLSNIGIYNDTEEPGAAVELFVIINEADMSKGEWTGNYQMHVPPAPVAGTFSDFGYIEGYGDTMYFEPGVSVDDYAVGVFADFEFECIGKGDVTITMMLGDATTVVDTLTISQVPEPMTIALLGLGGLLLRRRK